LKREIRPKRDFVDTSFHASCAFGHNPTLGLGFSYSWEMEPKTKERLLMVIEKMVIQRWFTDARSSVEGAQRTPARCTVSVAIGGRFMVLY
jgi:hypothetical protein